jgi:hypothetical protein
MVGVHHVYLCHSSTKEQAIERKSGLHRGSAHQPLQFLQRHCLQKRYNSCLQLQIIYTSLYYTNVIHSSNMYTHTIKHLLK